MPLGDRIVLWAIGVVLFFFTAFEFGISKGRKDMRAEILSKCVENGVSLECGDEF